MNKSFFLKGKNQFVNYQQLISPSYYPRRFHWNPDKIMFLDDSMTRKLFPYVNLWVLSFLLQYLPFMECYLRAGGALSCGTCVTSIIKVLQRIELIQPEQLKSSASTWAGTQLVASLQWHLRKHTWGHSRLKQLLPIPGRLLSLLGPPTQFFSLEGLEFASNRFLIRIQ